jgi:hypothetical protein
VPPRSDQGEARRDDTGSQSLEDDELALELEVAGADGALLVDDSPLELLDELDEPASDVPELPLDPERDPLPLRLSVL